MQSLNERLKPTAFEDLVAVLALYRPGPMESGMLDDFIDRKHGIKEIDYFYDEFTEPLEPILKPTYGVIVYQEQVMQIVQTIGGFSLGKADIVRRAMGKKKFDLMKKYKEEFANGAKEQGYKYEHAIELFELIEKFAGYGFNKSHSAAYAMITFQTTYLKYYYPQEFMAALLTSEQDNTDKIVKYIDEVKRLGIKLSPPSVRKSMIEFTAIKDDDGDETILFGLGALKGMGSSAITKILEARESENFKDLDDFLSKIDTSKVNKRVIESLIKSGSLDDFSYTRKAMLDNIEKIVETAGECARAKKMAENSLFGDDKELIALHVDIDNVAEFDMKKVLEFEKNTMGFYVSGHPLDEFREEIEGVKYTLSSEIENLGDGSTALFIGKVEEITEKISKKGNKFAILNLMDFHGNIEITLFSKHLDKIQSMNKEEPICLKVAISRDDRGVNKRVLKILNLKDSKKEKLNTKAIEVKSEPKTLIIDFNKDSSILEDVYRLVRENPGNRPLKLIISSKLQDIVLETYLKVSDEIDEKLRDMKLVKVA